jgi:microcystin-dependent protein
LSSTTSNYINKINQNYPLPGVDNDSQGFRDNYKNIALALNTANDEITDLQTNLVRLNQDNDFGQSLVTQAQFKNCSTFVYDNESVSSAGDLTVDYRNGSYQKISVGQGTHRITVSNWPGDNKSGNLTLAISKSTPYDTDVDFLGVNVVNLSSEPLPIKLITGVPVLFEIHSDGTSENLFVRKVNGQILDSITSTTNVNSDLVKGNRVTATTSLQLGSNIFTTEQSTTTYFTVVTNISTSSAGNLALLPNQVSTKFLGVVNDLQSDVNSSTSTQFAVTSIEGIRLNAKFLFNSTSLTATFTVLSLDLDGDKVTTTEFDSNLLTTPYSTQPNMIFTNPRFPGQPELLNLVTGVPTNVPRGRPGDLRGQVAADSTALYIAVADFAAGGNTWAKFNALDGSGSPVATQTLPVENNSLSLATTEFVHDILPRGTIIMWSGATKASIPPGWAVCDGLNDTPDLRGKFIVAATTVTSGIYAATSIGGHASTSTGASSASNTGDTTLTIDQMPLHSHPYLSGDTGVTATDGVGGFVRDASQIISYAGYTGSAGSLDGQQIGGTGGGQPHNHTIAHTHSVATVPQYYALLYIMKTTG